MNFEFLKDLTVLNGIYSPCKDAEDLVISKPYLSMTASRKSAELLAKFIYMAAHKEQVDSLGFAEILSDFTVRRYIGDREVMDAFHFIRKSGNRAVHGADADVTTDDALEVLEGLHFVAGETARKMELLADYPRFDSAVEEVADAKLHDIQDLDALAKQMLSEYHSLYQLEKLRHEIAVEFSPFKFVQSRDDIHERITFRKKPRNTATIRYLQEFFGYRVIRARQGFLSIDDTVETKEFSIILTIYGEQERKITDLEEVAYALLDELPEAEGFSVDWHYRGNEIAMIGGIEAERAGSNYYPTGMWDQCRKMMESEDFTYKIMCNYGIDGSTSYGKIHNGKSIDVTKEVSQKILKSKTRGWYSNVTSFDLYAVFDNEKYPDVRKALLKFAEDTLTKDEFDQTLDEIEWDKDHPEEPDRGVIFMFAQQDPNSLQELEDYLSQVNEILKPVLGVAQLDAHGEWENWDNFGYATIACTETGFHVVGVEY